MTNENIFDGIETQEETQQVFDKNGTTTEPVETNKVEETAPTEQKTEIKKSEESFAKMSLAELQEARNIVLDSGDLEELKSIDSFISEKENEIKAPSLDDLDDKPDAEKFKIVDVNTEIPKEGLILTIEEVYLQPPMLKNFRTGEIIKPEEKGYYKSKLVLKFKEEFQGARLKQSIPSIFYGVNEDGSVNRIPGIPKAVADEDMDDNMKSSLGKLRNLYCKLVKKAPNSVSSG